MRGLVTSPGQIGQETAKLSIIVQFIPLCFKESRDATRKGSIPPYHLSFRTGNNNFADITG